MKLISLTNGGFAKVSDKDYKEVSKYKWFRRHTQHTDYVARTDNGGVPLQNFLMSPPKGYVVDHKNGNGLDNTRENLRVCTALENARNLTLYSSNTSGFRGVVWHKGVKKWVARITVSYVRKNLGYFKDIEDAAVAYNKAAKKYFGEFAKLNIVSK